MSSGWRWPLTYLRVTDEYGMRIHPIYGTARLHRGIDLYATKNDAVYCAAIGIVSWAGYNGGEGNSVHVVHPDGSKTKYFHNTSLLVSKGQQVYEGSLIALAGTTGDSTGVHCHWETHDYADRDSPVNPRGFMDFRGAPFGSSSAAGGGNYTPITPEVEVAISEAEFARIRREAGQGTYDAFVNPKSFNSQLSPLTEYLRFQMDESAKGNPAVSKAGDIYQDVMKALNRDVLPVVRGGAVAYKSTTSDGQYAIDQTSGFLEFLSGEDVAKGIEAGLLRNIYADGSSGPRSLSKETLQWLINRTNKRREELGLAPKSYVAQ